MIEFLNWVNVMQEQIGRPRVNPQSAVKFLNARKFDVTRAVTLFRNHEVNQSILGAGRGPLHLNKLVIEWEREPPSYH